MHNEIDCMGSLLKVPPNAPHDTHVHIGFHITSKVHPLCAQHIVECQTPFEDQHVNELDVPFVFRACMGIKMIMGYNNCFSPKYLSTLLLSVCQSIVSG